MIVKLALERMTSEIEETYSNAAMQRGNDLEPEARDFYAFEKDVIVKKLVWSYIQSMSILPVVQMAW